MLRTPIEQARSAQFNIGLTAGDGPSYPRSPEEIPTKGSPHFTGQMPFSGDRAEELVEGHPI
jgi:hypothetical protein